MKTLTYIEVTHILKKIVRMMTSLGYKLEIYILKSLKNNSFSLLEEEICVPKIIFIFSLLQGIFKKYFENFEKSC